jgi:hypothetical protein
VKCRAPSRIRRDLASAPARPSPNASGHVSRSGSGDANVSPPIRGRPRGGPRRRAGTENGPAGMRVPPPLPGLPYPGREGGDDLGSSPSEARPVTKKERDKEPSLLGGES